MSSASEVLDELERAVNLLQASIKRNETAERKGAERMLEVFRTKVTERGLFFIQKDDERREPEANEYLDDIWAEYERLKEQNK